MHCNKVLFQELLHSFDNDLENNVWIWVHNAGNSEYRITQNYEHNYLSPSCN